MDNGKEKKGIRSRTSSFIKKEPVKKKDKQPELESNTEDNSVIKETESKDVNIDKEIKPDGLNKSHLSDKSPSNMTLDQSPLLSNGIIERGYSTNLTPDAGATTPQTEVGQTTSDEVKPGNNGKDSTASNDIFAPQQTPFVPDNVPEQRFTVPQSNIGGAGGKNGGGNNTDIFGDSQSSQSNPFGSDSGLNEALEIPDKAAKQASDDFADFLLQAYKRIVPDVAHNLSKINEKEIRKLENDGDLQHGALDDVKLANKYNRELLTNQAKEDANFIKKPLTKLLAIKQIDAPPHIQLLIAVVIVMVGYFFLVKTLKSQNEELIEKLTTKINDRRNTNSDNIPFMTTEEVK